MFNWETIIETITIFAILGGIVSAFILDYKYILISALFIVVFFYIRKKKKERLIKYYRDKFREQWGKEHIEKRDILSSRKLYDFLEDEREGKFAIDDITWSDLNMDSVFKKIDHTKSMPGMNYLYNILRNPIFNKRELVERNKWINLLLENKIMSQEIQRPLSILGKKEGKEVFTYFRDGLNVKTKNLFLYRILSYLSYFSIVMLVINRQFGFAMFI